MRRRWLPLLAGMLLLLVSTCFMGCASSIRMLGPAVAPSAVFRVACQERVVALTIDDGPVEGSTQQLLEVLDRTGAHATFFLVGERAAANPHLVEAIVGAGHEVGNHTWQETPTHRLAQDAARASIMDTHQMLSPYENIRWLRPGSARYDDEILALAQEMGYVIALGDTFPYDTFVPFSRFHAWYIRHGVRAGSIIVLHNAHGRGKRAAETLSKVIPLLSKDGYEVLSLTELVSHPACIAENPPELASQQRP